MQNGHSPDGPANYNPTLPRFSSVLHMALPSLKISYLDLYCQRFGSGVDLLRLLGSMSRLRTVKLNLCTFDSPLPATYPLIRPTMLNEIEACPVLWFPAVCWRWPHPTLDQHVGPYPGLDRSDARVIASFLQLMPWNASDLKRPPPKAM